MLAEAGSQPGRWVSPWGMQARQLGLAELLAWSLSGMYGEGMRVRCMRCAGSYEVLAGRAGWPRG